MTQRIVICTTWGGFGLTQAMEAELAQVLPDVHPVDIENGTFNQETRTADWSWRAHPLVVAAVERGLAASPKKLKIVEVPAGVEWTVQNYEGREWVAEKHRTWR